MTTTQSTSTLSLETELHRIISRMRASIATGEDHWLLAVLEAIRSWPLPDERVGDRSYHYLIAGEAFDWLLLAERLCDEIEDLIPEQERAALLFHGRLPLQMDDDEFNRLLGAKHRAHLNFVYGVRVETALQLAVQAELHKEHLSRVWANGHADDELFRRIYGGTRDELLTEWCEDSAPLGRGSGGVPQNNLPGGRVGQRTSRNGDTGDGPHSVPDHISLSDLSEFTYWLFKRRLNNADPARVASDTRKGLAMLQRLEAIRRSSP
jgi:hypothetical protein